MLPIRSLVFIASSAVVFFACGGATFGTDDSSNLEVDGGEPLEGAGGAHTGSGGAGSGGWRTGPGGKVGSGGKGTGGQWPIGVGGSGTGGEWAVGAGGQGTGGEGPYGVGGGQVCCDALPTCGLNEKEISDPAQCPPGYTCRVNTVCCSTLWCATPLATCGAIPSCDPGDSEVSGPCPPDLSCYERTLCGATIWCHRPDRTDAGPAVDGGSCDPSAEHARHYFGTPAECAGIAYFCPAYTQSFTNACGCGCEQDSACPPGVDCMPGSGTSPLCADLARCPYTERWQ